MKKKVNIHHYHHHKHQERVPDLTKIHEFTAKVVNIIYFSCQNMSKVNFGLKFPYDKQKDSLLVPK